MNSSAAAAVKRKGSFKKWFQSSHRKFTSNGGASNASSRTSAKTDVINGIQNTNPTQKYLNLSSSSYLKVNIFLKLLEIFPTN